MAIKPLALALLCFTILSLPRTVIADSVYSIEGGIGVGNSDGMRTVNLGIADQVWGALVEKGSVGLWADGPGSASGYAAYQLGWHISTGGVAISLYTGPCLITTPDILLGSPLEFMSDLHVDFYNRDGMIGVYYRHISDAGLTLVNVGRDSIGLELGW